MAFKVKELIVRLKQYNPEARVVLQHYNGTQEDDYDYLYLPHKFQVILCSHQGIFSIP